MSSVAGQIVKSNIQLFEAGNGFSCLQPTSSHLQTTTALRTIVDSISFSPFKPFLVSGCCCHTRTTN